MSDYNAEFSIFALSFSGLTDFVKEACFAYFLIGESRQLIKK